MKISIFFLLFISLPIFSEQVKIGIVGYTLLDEFRIETNSETEIVVDGKRYFAENLLISSSGEVIGDSFDALFNNLEIKNSGVITFISNKGLQTYKGNFIIKYNDGLTIINSVEKDYYLASVLGSEMGLTFHVEALKAQLLAIKLFYEIRKARNYKKDWDILNTSRVMAYRGDEYVSSSLLDIVFNLKNTNLILPHNIEPMFFSTSAGYILRQECLTSDLNFAPRNPLFVIDDNINSPYYSFNITLTKEELTNLLSPYIDNLFVTGIELKKFKGTSCNDFIGFIDNGSDIKWLKAYRFVSIIQRFYGSQFKSIQFDVVQDGDSFVFNGNGFGHFIGMSQYGAQKMALEGKSYKQILNKYYPRSSYKSF